MVIAHMGHHHHNTIQLTPEQQKLFNAKYHEAQVQMGWFFGGIVLVVILIFFISIIVNAWNDAKEIDNGDLHP